MSDPKKEAFWARVVALANDLDSMSYYHLLGVEPGADLEAIEEAYYRRIRGVHPDRHTYERDAGRQRALLRLHARMGEGFRVLRSPETRRAYDEGLARGNTRLDLDGQRKSKVEASGPDPRTPHARQMFEKGQAMIASGNVAGGLAQLKLAAQFEPDSRAIAAALAAAEPPVEGTSEGDA